MYSLAINIVSFFLRIAALWNHKLRLFVDGRKGLLDRIASAVKGHEGIIWFHTASMGEFEETRPVIEAVRKRYPEKKILLTFFSPSGYEVRKDWKVVDWVFYLPLDTARNARRFVEIVRPAKAMFTIGEFWFNYLKQLRIHGVDTYIMSVLATKDSPYLKWYGGIYRRLLRTSYRSIMAKNEETRKALESIGCKSVYVAGDARFDRVADTAAEEWHDAIVEKWNCGRKVFVAGSTCHKDDDLVISLCLKYPDEKFLFIPHELDEAPIRHIAGSVKNGAVIYSEVEDAIKAAASGRGPSAMSAEAEERLEKAQVLIVNKIGMLSRLYRYGWAALIGGGFINMPHSVIEASVYGLPVVMGPQYHKNLQFVELMPSGAAVPVSNDDEIGEWFGRLHDNPEYLAEVSKAAYDYCRKNSGATAMIMGVLFG